VLIWIALQNAGVGPTLAGVIVAAAIPIDSADESKSLLHRTEHSLRPWVMFGVMPVFAFANAGVSFAGVGDYLLHPITLGIFIGLFHGKPIGITLFAVIGAKFLKMPLPGTLPQVAGVGLIAGVGFTMSLFIGALAFQDESLATPVRLGVYFGSVSAAIFGFILLALSLPKVGMVTDEEGQTEDFIV
jgi:Na+:H+ antiporter, NhaA family